MNLIDNEIIKLKECARKVASETEYSFPLYDDSVNSYYIDYEDSKHLDGAISVYYSEKAAVLREILQTMWIDDELTKPFIPIVLASIMKLYNSEAKIKDIDLYNYMM